MGPPLVAVRVHQAGLVVVGVAESDAVGPVARLVQRVQYVTVGQVAIPCHGKLAPPGVTAAQPLEPHAEACVVLQVERRYAKALVIDRPVTVVGDPVEVG